MDTIGRRITIIIGLYIQALLFVVLSLNTSSSIINIPEQSLLTILAIMLGIGFSTNINAGSLLMIELAEEHHIYNREKISVYMFFGSIGLTFGVIMDEIFFDNLASLSIVLLFVIISATLVVFQLDETLPTKEEREWRKAIKYILVLQNDGLVLYAESLRDENDMDVTNEVLIGGAVVAISSIVSEIVATEGSIKIIEQEHYSLLIEEKRNILVVLIVNEQLSTIRERMQDFIDDFLLFFSEVLSSWQGDQAVFLPTKELVKRHLK